MEDTRPHLLTVDDTPENLDVLIGLLGSDYRLSVATSGNRALERVEEKTKAFTSGGVDYVTEPFQPEELEACISTHLALRRMQKELAEASQAAAALDEETTESFFGVFSTARNRSVSESLGLKPAVAERIVSLYGGAVQLQNRPPHGTEIRIALMKCTASAS